MKATSRALLAFSLFLVLTALPTAAQQRPAQDADLLRTKIEQFEKTGVNSNSSLVQIVYQRTLLALYSEFNSVLRQDIAELKAMRDIVSGTAAGSQNEIATQIQKLEQEQSDIAEKMQTLKTGVQVAALTGAPVPRPAPRAVPQAETARAAQQPETTYVSYAPRIERPRPEATSIPISDTLAASDSARPIPRAPRPVQGDSLKEKCANMLADLDTMTDEQKEAALKGKYKPLRLYCPSPGLTGLLLGGVVVSQQEQNFSQADPFFGFVVGYNSRVKTGGGIIHWRVQGIFQVQPQTAEAPPADASATPNPTPTPVDPTNFIPFLASRKTFDIDTHIWVDYPLPPGILRVGPYFGWGASTYIDKNELKGDEAVTKADSAGAAETKLDPALGRAPNDLKQYQEAGIIGNFLRPSDGNLFMQAQLLYGRYEALKNLVPGHNTSNRFIGRLRIFPTGLKVALTEDPNDKGISMSPMFGVEINAGRGPDQVKFFTGVAISITKFKPFAPPDEDNSGGGGGGGGGGNSGGTNPTSRNRTVFQ